MEPDLRTELTSQLRLARDDLNMLRDYMNRKELLQRWLELDNELHVRILRDETLKPMVPAVERLRQHIDEKLAEHLHFGQGDQSSSDSD